VGFATTCPSGVCHAEARRIAANVAKLPDLLGRPQYYAWIRCSWVRSSLLGGLSRRSRNVLCFVSRM
jgi:hypothetical protein